MRAIGISWSEDRSQELAEVLTGTVVSAELFGSEGLVLIYSTGRRVEIQVQQCSTHHCDDTYLLVRDPEEA